MNNVEPTILTRQLDAPIQLVYDAWTQVEHLKNWQFPQQGFRCEFSANNIASGKVHEGGKTLHKMIAPNGFEMWLLTLYEELSSPNKIVFLQYPSNEDGEMLSLPNMPNWPKHMRTTILLEEKNGKTHLQLIWQPIDATEAEINAFEASRADHANGWGAGLEQLVRYLSEQ